VSPPSQTWVAYRFSTFEADPQSGELRKNGVRLRIQDQPFQILVRLLERAGQIVTREDRKTTLWSSDTFVDFDNGLNRAVKRLREVLEGDADRPTFIETIPRKGYRFIAEVKSYVVPKSKPAAALPPKGQLERFKKCGWISFVSVTVVLLGMIASSHLWQQPAESLNPSIEVVPLVAMEGKQGWPALGYPIDLVSRRFPRRNPHLPSTVARRQTLGACPIRDETSVRFPARVRWKRL
jgi:DNA-binding winged helix-turn-helix (wHTH) protein